MAQTAEEINMRTQADHLSERSQESSHTAKGAVIAVYATHTEAEAAIRTLEKSGADMRTLSIVGKDYQKEEEVVGYYSTGDRMKAWGKTGAFWGGLWGLMFGSAFFLIPGIGPLLVAGPLVGWIVGALEGAALVAGLSALGASLYSIGLSKDSIIEYETHIKAGRYVLIAHGSSEEIAKSKSTLSLTKHQGIKDHVDPA